MKPSVGRIVHYTNLGDRDGRYPPEVQAAIITKVVERHEAPAANLHSAESYRVSLRIFYEMGDFAMVDVPFTMEPAGSEGARGRWTWPERVQS